MKVGYHIEFKDYAPLLEEQGICFTESDSWLTIRKPDHVDQWVLFITVRTLQAIDLFQKVFPVLAMENTAFRMVKNQLLHYHLNAGWMGISEVGKVVAIFPETERAAVRLANQLATVSKGFKGPSVPNSLKLGDTLYALHSKIEKKEKNEKVVSLYIPKKRSIPFDGEYSVEKKRKRVVGKHYLPVEVYNSHAKGDTIRCISVKRFVFSECVIKKGKACTVDDHFGRDIKDRLLWQKYVTDDISKDLNVPKVLDYFEDADNSYLVFEFIEGFSIAHQIKEAYKKDLWGDFPDSKKVQLLGYYAKILDAVKTLHQLGYVHRDITADNILITKWDQVYLIDFEISFSVKIESPDPPFIFGTDGYVSPEQAQYCMPTFKEDIYSLGALLGFMLTGTHPTIFVQHDSSATYSELLRMTANRGIVELIMQCLHSDPLVRPDISDIKIKIESEVAKLKGKNVKVDY